MCREDAHNSPNAPAFEDRTTSVMWEEFDRRVTLAANAFSEYVTKGDRVAFLCKSSVDHERAIGKASVPEFSKDLFEDIALLESTLSGYTAERSLEIGCGFGRLTPWIARYAADHHAIEPEEELIADAKRLYPDVTFHQTPAHQLPYADGEFDLIVTWEVIQHVPDVLIRDVVAELERVATPDSLVVISEKVGGTEATNRVYARDGSEYSSMFSSKELTDTIERQTKKTFWNDDHKHAVLLFE